MIKNKKADAYIIFKRIATSNKKTDLKELETLNVDSKKKFNLNSIFPTSVMPADSAFNENKSVNTDENAKELLSKPVY